MPTYFISDLHLEQDRPDITELFLQFLKTIKPADELYILGDFFCFWLGDDDPSSWLVPIKKGLQRLTGQGTKTYFMVGNRDFAVGKAFCHETGITFLKDPTITHLNGQRTLLLHGDSLCTDDVGYQRYRAFIRNPVVLFILRNLPLATRLKIAQKLRRSSQDKQSQMALDELDVNTAAVAQCMDDWQVDLMIHGHTHRPKIHNHARSEGRGTRIVLGDWYTQGSILELNDDGFNLYSLPLPKL
ncbi:UDP-2,3-diacylglucosamine diphosphatase [Saccharobesus litoralis]|uniref:UDP-2,3-diacylglucosamine hydrolase n=1 Tax=Saccharobesus litoralis TaxID=2172099 RepID=A0A2S0VU67_9ALTE|nr:UDP-2,3-diacylglucosamine diphosphatase [Saccharobesus litoralis]AWB67758.1 UDP-2,3-diacylglucosamine diphosphatase [Saccharobesus litoralis]